MNPMYRPEIDGLRALAVLPVILFHAGFSWFGGGYVGVDIFFVISGYLITSILIKDLEREKFSLSEFYERRARRILPALFFIMAACLPFAWLWFTPNELMDFGQSIIAVSTFSSNILFWSESGYFNAANELKPLLHTWSLSIEEQYYIIFPIFLMVTWRLGLKWLLISLSLVFLLSLGLAHWGAYNIPSANFYLLPTRGWELLIGVFAAFYLAHKGHFKSRYLNQILSLLGFSMVAFSIISYDGATPFPSLYALVPTFGAALLIISAVPNTLIHTFLSTNFLVGIGLISYSAYLWHQPLLAFARHRSLGDASDILLICICVFSLILAWITWRFVEKPFRNREIVSRKNILYFSLIGLCFFILLGLLLSIGWVSSNNQLPTVKYENLGDRIEKEGYICKVREVKIQEGLFLKACEFGSPKKTDYVLLYGDSHAEAISYELEKKLSEIGKAGIWVREIIVNGISCSTIIFTKRTDNYQLKDSGGCESGFKKIFEVYPIKQAIYVNRWTLKYYPVYGYISNAFFKSKHLDCTELEEYREYVPITGAGVVENSVDNKRNSIINFLRLMPKDVLNVLVYPIPETGCDTYKLNLLHNKKRGENLKELAFPIAEYTERNRFVIQVFDQYTQNVSQQHIKVIKMPGTLCESGRKGLCYVIKEHVPFYLDDDHLSDAGAKLITDKIFR